MTRAAMLTLLLVACSGGESAPPTTVAAPATTTTPAPATTTAATTHPDIARGRARLADARRAVTASDFTTALAAFDDVLAIMPSEPRLLCEAGFVAHRAGRSALASARIDAALAAFGPAQGGTHSVRLAQCLYNRGLVDEAAGDFAHAVDHYRLSLSLRPNATVQTHLTSALAHATPPSSADTIGGVPVDVSDHAMLVHAPDRATLEHALQIGMSGWNDAGGFTTEQTTVRVLAEHGDVIVYDVRTQDAQYDVDSLVLARPEAGGFRVVIGATEYANSDHGDTITIAAVTATDLGPYLRIDARGHELSNVEAMDDTTEDGIDCWGSSSRADDYVTTLVCRTSPNLACARAGYHTSMSDVHEELETNCMDAAGNDVERPNEEHSGEGVFALSVVADAEGRVTIATASGTPSQQEVLGTFTFDALLSGEHTHVEAATGHTDRERAAVE